MKTLENNIQEIDGNNESGYKVGVPDMKHLDSNNSSGELRDQIVPLSYIFN